MSEPDESDDEVFRSHPSSRLTVSAASNFGPPSEHDLRADAEKMTVVHTVPSTPQQEPANPTPPVEGSESNPFADLKSVNIPITPTPSASIHPTPAPVASQPSAPVPIMPVPIPNTPESVNDNPFTEFEVSAAAPTPATPGKVKVTPIPIEPELDKNRPHKQQKLAPKDDNELDEQKETEQDEAGTEQTVRGRDRTAAKASGGINPVILFAVIGYAVLATAIAVYGMFFKSSDAVDTGHPLSTIPDNFGEFDPATRKKVSLYKFRVDGELPAAQRGKLGDKIVVGDLEIQPEEIVKRRLTIETESKSGDEKLVNYTGPALVLRLKITNNSDVSLYPMDPAFTRRSVGDDRPITRIVVDKKNVFAGGAITWPFGDRVKKQMEHQQANDYVPLAPGDKREYVVFTDAKPNIIKAVESSKDTMEWRIQVRRAPISYRHKEIPVTAIIGVDFTAADIKG